MTEIGLWFLIVWVCIYVAIWFVKLVENMLIIAITSIWGSILLFYGLSCFIGGSQDGPLRIDWLLA